MRDELKILRYLDKHKDKISPLLILMHNYPDPDAIASAFALHYVAETKYGIKAKIVYAGVIGRMENRAMVEILDIPIEKYDKKELQEAQHIALVDTQPAFENNPYLKSKKATIIIDQHKSLVEPNADLTVIDPDIGATSIILARCLLELNIKIPEGLSTALVYGILSDTAHFFRCSDRKVIKTYLNILPSSNLSLLAKIQNPPRSKSFFNITGTALQKAVFMDNSIVSHLGSVRSPDLVAQMTDLLYTYKKVVWALCTGRYRGKMYVSLRGSDDKQDACAVLRDIVPDPNQAGGHDVIAGGSFPVGKECSDIEWNKAESNLMLRLKKRLNMSKDCEILQDPFDLKNPGKAKVGV
jgi:nanoRNase/pAp phosphatase (c-di-AMP/oligoRNAs hydrolase)